MTAPHDAWLTHLQQRWPDTEFRIMFHGTAHGFDAFTEDSIGQGGDANSALGVHLAEWPHTAGEYAEANTQRDTAGTKGRVLVVALAAYRPSQDLNDFFLFFGEPDEARPGLAALEAKDHAHFARERQRLIAAGHDVVDYEDGEQVISVALNPADLVIVGELTPEVACELFERMEGLEDSFDPAARLRLIGELQQGWAPRALPTSQVAPRRGARGPR